MKMFLATALVMSVCVTTVHATYSRIEAMGKNSTYILDDMSIFDNPANIGIYPNYLIGEMGSYLSSVDEGNNLDPQHSWFGGIFSLSLDEEEDWNPRVSIAGAFNRTDEKIFKYIPTYILTREYVGVTKNPDAREVVRIADMMGIQGFDSLTDSTSYAWEGALTKVPAATTNFDGFLGYATQAGNLFGLHIYVAYQDGAYQNNKGLYQIDSKSNVSVVKFDGGANIQLTDSIDAELSVGIASIQYGNGTFIDESNLSYFASGRLFSSIKAIRGELVPAFSYASYAMPGRETSELQLGVGVNVSMDDQGFFWLGVDFLRNHNTYSGAKTATRLYSGFYNTDEGLVYSTFRGTPGSYTDIQDVMTETGGKISFGIERAIWWDWFIVRVGGQKVITYVECETAEESGGYCGEFTEASRSGNYMRTNVSGDGTNSDHVGFGFGFNVEEKLKIDVTVAEDILFRNPFAGEGRFFSRLSASYSF